MAGHKLLIKIFWFIFLIFEPKLCQFKLFPQNVCSTNLAVHLQYNTLGPQKIFGGPHARGPQFGHLWYRPINKSKAYPPHTQHELNSLTQIELHWISANKIDICHGIFNTN
jgi:hypothetical protein